MSLFEEFQYPSLLIDFAKYTIELGDNDDPNLVGLHDLHFIWAIEDPLFYAYRLQFG